MVKRRPISNGELRTSPIHMSVHRYTNLPSIRHGIKEHWNIETFQPFFPSIEKLFKTTVLENPSEYGIRFTDEISSIVSSDSVKLADGSIREVHKKISMILSPYKWMQGDYGMLLGLPSTAEQSSLRFGKLQSPNNSSYVGSIVSSALSQSGCDHFPKVYGVYSGISNRHTIDISDDYGDLCDRNWFTQNIGKTFEISLSEMVHPESEFRHTRSARLPIELGDEIGLGDVQELDAPTVSAQMGDLNRIFEEPEADDENSSETSSVSTSRIFDIESCDCESEEDGEEEIDDEDCESEPFAWATFTNVPVQVTVMEKCSGTLYQLLMMNPGKEKHMAWLSQVMFALAFAQRNFAFTHNDLHANNVMYVETDKDYLYYNCGGTLYKVPTYGYIIKIIDFERCVVSIRLQGMREPKLFMSDHFSVEEEAGGQYNYGDFYIPKYPEIKPNPSFDLCRLATSLFWDLFPEGPKHEEYSEDTLFKMFMRWLTLEDGTSILFSKDNPKHDRFHGFELYKAIARLCKDNAVPRKEIVNLKSLYGVDSVEEGYSVLLIDV